MSRRHKGTVANSFSGSPRDKRIKLGHDLFMAPPHRDTQHEHLSRTMRNLSPRHAFVEGARKDGQYLHSLHNLSPHPVALEEARLNRKRDIECEIYRRQREADKFHPRHRVPSGRLEKRPHIDERALDHVSQLSRRYDCPEYVDCNEDAISMAKHGYGFKYNDHMQMTIRQDYSERRLPVCSPRGALVKNILPVREGIDSQSARRYPDYVLASGYGEASHSFSPVDIQKFKKENDHYQNEMPPEKAVMQEYYKEKEKYVCKSREGPYQLSSPSKYEDFGNQQVLIKGNPSSSSRLNMRDKCADGPQDADIMPPFHEYSRMHEIPTEPLGACEYCQKPHLDLRKEYGAGYVDMKCHQCKVYGPAWSEHEDGLYGYSRAEGKDDDPGCISNDGLYKEVPVHFQAEPECRYLQRPVIEEPIAGSGIVEAEGSRRIMREYDIIQNETIPNPLEIRRTFDAPKHSENYMDAEYTPADFGGRPSRDNRFYEPSFTHEIEISDDDYTRYVNARSLRDRFKSAPEFIEDLGTYRVVGRAEKFKADVPVGYDRSLKGKYRLDEEVGRINSGGVRLHKWSATSEAHNFGDCGAQWGFRSGGGLHLKEPSKNKYNFYLEAEKMFDEMYCRKDSGRHGWSLSHQGKWENTQERPRKPFESVRKYLKGGPQSEYSTSYGRPPYVNQRSDYYRVQKSVDRSSGDAHAAYTNYIAQDANLAERPGGPLMHNHSEDSEAFKLKVNQAFLIFSKKLNENPPIRKLYKDQGKSGTLFCIVCGRSASKEFLNSERLARHTFMSHKAGLREQHLGLFIAICVLMGWDTLVPKDVIAWLPQALPYPEAMAQKQDLIIWNPVIVIHNISMSNKNHKEWKVISLEALSEIIRGKTFIKSRIKICLGYPGDQSVILVKFLGTFTGLQEAEKLHKHLAENGRGRRDFEQAISNMGKSSGAMQGGASEAETLDEESLLYGYMGISEDLDRVDFDTKRRCSIKSKKEIQDIADAPLKPE